METDSALLGSIRYSITKIVSSIQAMDYLGSVLGYLRLKGLEKTGGVCPGGKSHKSGTEPTLDLPNVIKERLSEGEYGLC